MFEKTMTGGLMVFILASAGVAIGSVSVAGCSAVNGNTAEESFESSESVGQPIVGGQPASTYTEAALINANGFICSGAMIAPRIALTAGHCIGGSSYNVVTPYANKSARGTRVWTNYVNTGGTVNPNTLDVGVIILDTPIDLAWYPPLANTASPSGTTAVNVGRIRDGQASFSALFYGRDVTLRNPAGGFPLAYSSVEVIQSGDSGGPVYTGSGSSRKIIAVNSGAGGGTQILARVDLAYQKIQELIAANGGPGGGSSSGGTSSGGTSSGGTSSGGTSSGGTSSGSSGTACTNEAEPNDQSPQANALAAKSCGALTSGDVDWYTWDVAGAGVTYDVSLTTTGDAEILMWKKPTGATSWSKITNNSPTQFAATSNGGGVYVVAVHSTNSSAQSYSLTLTK